jgi:hypothetical protein
MACTPSARFEEQFPEQESSDYAREGTLAHELGELELQLYNEGHSFEKQYHAGISEITRSPLFTTDMPDEVSKYVEYTISLFEEAKRRDELATLTLEQKFDLRDYIPDGFGTSDATITGGNILDVGDLKYGKGVKVYAEKNPQLMLYGLGALLEAELLTTIDTVRLHIIQPRLDHIDVWELPAEELKAWAKEEVKVKAESADLGTGDLVAGSHCKWCRAKNRCPALASLNLDLARDAFAPPEALSDDQLVNIYGQLPTFEEWAKDIAKYMLDEAVKGKEWDGLKLVEGRSNRKWTNETLAISALRKKGFLKKDVTNTKIKGIGDIEKLVKKSNFNDIVGAYVVKPDGKPSLVSEDDKRPDFRTVSIEKAFGEEI